MMPKPETLNPLMQAFGLMGLEFVALDSFHWGL